MSEADRGSSPAEAAAELEGGSGFTVSLENFDGPFDLLLGLIAKREMDVTTLALATVTDEFVAYVRRLSADAGVEDGHFSPKALEESSSFVLVAATLLDLKAAQLLPSGEVDSEEDLAALEARDLLFARLLQYRAFKVIASQMRSTFDDNAMRFPREPGVDPQLAGLLPDLVWKTPADDLRAIAEKAFSRPEMEPDDVAMDHLHAHVVNVSEEISAMTRRLRASTRLTFTELVGDAESRLVVVVRFLGLLELFRDQDVELDQESPLGELVVTWAGSSQSGTEMSEAGAGTLRRAAQEWDD